MVPRGDAGYERKIIDNSGCRYSRCKPKYAKLYVVVLLSMGVSNIRSGVLYSCEAVIFVFNAGAEFAVSQKNIRNTTLHGVLPLRQNERRTV